MILCERKVKHLARDAIRNPLVALVNFSVFQYFVIANNYLVVGLNVS